MPSLIWCKPGKILMRTYYVVPNIEIPQQIQQRFACVDLDQVELLLERAEKAFDPAVHPGAARHAELLFDSCKPASPAEDPAAKYARVVGAGRTRRAVTANREKQVAEECPRVLAL